MSFLVLLAIILHWFSLGNGTLQGKLWTESLKEAGIFSRTFLLPVNGSKNSILNRVFKTQSLLSLFFKKTSYQNLYKYKIRKRTICLQSQSFLLINSSTRCLNPHIACSTISFGVSFFSLFTYLLIKSVTIIVCIHIVTL